MLHFRITIGCILLFVFGISFAENYQHMRFYKPLKSLGMGGVGIVNSGTVDGMYSNPANLYGLPEEQGLDVRLLSVTAGLSDGIGEFYNDINSARDAGDENAQSQAMLDVINNNLGETFSASGSFVPLALGMNTDLWGIDALGFALITDSNMALRAHNGFGSEGLLEINSLSYGGFLLGGAKHFDSLLYGEDMVIGINTKFLTYASIARNFTIAELLDDDFIDEVTDNHLKRDNVAVFDLGLVWDLPYFRDYSPQFGVVASNLGGGIGQSSSVYIPSTVDFGLSMGYRFSYPFLESIQVAADYIDVLNAYDDEADFQKRLNMGLDWGLFENSYFNWGIQLGLHQGSGTYGTKLIAGFFEMGYATYVDEFGVYAGQDPVEKQIYHLAFSW